jgi:signal transduction histidine kinase
MRIRSRLLVLVFAILLPSMIGAGLGIYYVYHAQQESYRDSIQDLANAMARLLDKEITERIKILDTLSRSPTITDNNLQGFYRFALEVASTRDTVIVLSDAEGQQFMNTRSPFGTKNLPKMTPSIMALRQKLGPDAPIISDVYFAPLGKNHSFAVQVPVEREGRILYYLSMGTFTSHLQKLLEEQKLPAGWIATIIDRQGVVAARTHDPAKFVGARADETLRMRIAAEKQGTNDGRTLDGTPVTAFFSQAPNSEWTFLVSVPRSALVRPATQATTFVAVIALLLLGVGGAAAAVIARKTAKPMEDLRRTAVELGQGKAVARQSTGVLEIDAVSMELARASEQIRSSKAELEHRVAEAVATAERSQKALLQSQKLEALGRLTGGIAHDFNNVMQTLTTGLQLMLFAAKEPHIRQTAEACQRAVERAAELTRQLMAFGRVQDAHLLTIDLAQQLEQIQPLLKGGLRSNIDLQIEAAPGLWPVTVDPTQLELALLNVAINARDAMPAGGRLTISMQNVSLPEAANEAAAGDYVQIAMTDTGEGMSAEVQNKALDPFFTTKPVGQGSGMGLAQAYGFARQVGGSLVIESAPGKGTTIRFYLPRESRADAARAQPMPSMQPLPLEAVKSAGRLLFVEDDPLVTAVVAPALRARGFDVYKASNSEEALNVLTREGPFDVMFSDVVMPGQMTGIDLAQYVRQHFPHTRIVLASGYSSRRADVPGVKILGKPYDVAEAVELIMQS